MINIAILGLGNIGGGVAEMLTCNQQKIKSAVGDDICVKYVLDKRDLSDSPYAACAVHDFDVILNDPTVSIVCEMMGGTQPAFDYSMAALMAKKSVVTSNKEVVARFGIQLLEAARENGVHYLYEASVGGGIPILHAFDDSLKGCHIGRIDGILNGTTNYVLSRMHDCSSSFEDALDEARRLGYAEANPTADISGADACRKICILAAVAWGKLVPSENVYCEGITEIMPVHHAFATACGGALKLVASAQTVEGSLYLAVSPCVVMNDNPLCSVKGVYNAVNVDAKEAGNFMFYGMGAGRFPTASAVISDILAIIRRRDATDSYCFFEENDMPLLAFEEAKTDFCVAVRATRQEIAGRLRNFCLLKEEDDILYLLCEALSKRELAEALDCLDTKIVLRAIV